MIVESILVTRDPDGRAHVAPLGVHVDESGTAPARYLIAPYRPSRSLDHLLRERAATVNWTDDVRLYAGPLTGRRDWPVVPAQVLDGAFRLRDAQTVLELRVVRVDDDPQRPRLWCEAVHEHVLGPFRGFNRAQAAVIEAAVLVSRASMLPRERLERELQPLHAAIDKTAGEREREAWLWLHDGLRERYPDWPVPQPGRPSAQPVPVALHRGSAALGAPRPRLLVSVSNEAELGEALQHGAEVIDLKDPADGSLGAVDMATMQRMLERLGVRQWIANRAAPAGKRLPVSATIGDLPADPDVIEAACVARLDAGVDYVKIGLAPGAARDAVIDRLGARRWPYGLVAVLFADAERAAGGVLHGDASPAGAFDALLARLAASGFAGVVVDTFGKTRRLTEWLDAGRLARLVATVQRHGLFCGLAGSLRIDDIDAIASTGADLIGLRGGLCDGSDRVAPLSAARLAEAARRLDAARARRRRPRLTGAGAGTSHGVRCPMPDAARRAQCAVRRTVRPAQRHTLCVQR